MDVSATAAAWLSFAVTAVGLGSLVSQASAINEKIDPFHANRTVEYLGVWFKRQNHPPWWVIAKPPPHGPMITAKLSEGFCGRNIVYLSRLPFKTPGKAGWTVLLAVFHGEPSTSGYASSISSAEKDTQPLPPVASDPWQSLSRGALLRHGRSACIPISRTTLITIMCLTNARQVFQHSDAAGFRAAYSSYIGQWYVTWPIGQDAFVQFAAHDSHSTGTDVYPPLFMQRVDRCVQMLAGIISAPNMKVAFCGRKPHGSWTLKFAPKGFPGAHGSRHLYNMMGGKVYEVDFLFARKNDAAMALAADTLQLRLPGRERGSEVTMNVYPNEERIIEQALDCLPWTTLSWSIHRGMKDILVAYAKPVMDAHRAKLAEILKQTVLDNPQRLDARGWNSRFVRENMGDMAASSVLANSGDSGDMVRVVTDIILVKVGDLDIAQLDETTFWRSQDRELDSQGVIALTKMFVLEWSNEFDYQLYHNFPLSMYFG